jgi:hypothetical protein
MSIRTFIAILICTAFCACKREDTTHTASIARPHAESAAAVDASALEALTRMYLYLTSLEAVEITSVTTTDQVSAGGQRTQSAGRVVYRMRKPDGFVVDMQDERRPRQFFYDGRTLTMVAPRAGFYTEILAPPNIAGALDVAAEDYGLQLPLMNLLALSRSDRSRARFSAAAAIGPSAVGGVETMQYSFHQRGREWRIWIASGERPLPLKITVSNVSGPRMDYDALLTWNLSPNFSAETFHFAPRSGSRRIPINLADSATNRIAYTLPGACVMRGWLGATYYECGELWYEPRFSGSVITYAPITPPQQITAWLTSENRRER